jgi:hypothetical protein
LLLRRTETGSEAGALGDWNDPLNWDTGVPTTDTADNIFVRLPGTITGPAINAGILRIAVGTPSVSDSGFTFGTGTFSFSEIQVADAHDGLNPTSNRYGGRLSTPAQPLRLASFSSVSGMGAPVMSCNQAAM